MSTAQCERLSAAVRNALARPPRVLLLLGGPDYWSNGIHLHTIEAAACWQPPPGVLATLPGLRLVQSMAAGIDHLTNDPTLPQQVPLCRIVDPEMASGMAAYSKGAMTAAAQSR